MTEKLSKDLWASFTKKQKLEIKDDALVKALVALDRVGEKSAEPRLEALHEVVEQVKKQILALAREKKALGDKLFSAAKSQLDELLDEAEAQQKRIRSSAEDEEADTPDLLGDKMKPLVRDLRRGGVTMPALIAVAGRETLVLVSRRPISPARGALLKAQMENAGGIKFIRGECQFENNALVFIVESPASALAKRLRQALLDQIGLKLKVRVRGEDGQEEEDGEDGGEQQGVPPPGHQAPGVVPGGGGAGDVSAEVGTAFKARLAALIPRIKDALQTGGDQAQDAKLLASQAGIAAGKRSFSEANGLLDRVERLLNALATSQGTAPSERSVVSGATDDAFLKHWATAKAHWREAIETVDGQIAKLQTALRAIDDNELHEIAEFGLPALTGNHKTPLMAALLDVDSADPATRPSKAARAASIAQSFKIFLQASEAVDVTDSNAFGVTVSIRSSLCAALEEIEAAGAMAG